MAPVSLPTPRLGCLLGAALLGTGCASVEFTRETETSGRFTSSGTALTIVGYDFPGGAMQIALDNASDARQPNTEITQKRVFPYLGPLDWIFDILSVRHARISGTWGFTPGSGSDSFGAGQPATALGTAAGTKPAETATPPLTPASGAAPRQQ
jgi:hypothetical protein